jgi:hypothetical protein
VVFHGLEETGAGDAKGDTKTVGVGSSEEASVAKVGLSKDCFLLMLLLL